MMSNLTTKTRHEESSPLDFTEVTMDSPKPELHEEWNFLQTATDDFDERISGTESVVVDEHTITALEYHEFCLLFPQADESTLDELAESIRQNGFYTDDPVVMYEGKILDGRTRHLSCLKVGVVPKYVRFEDIGFKGTPLQFVISKNLHRRHLDESQRAMVCAKIEIFRHGGSRKNQDANLHLDRKSVSESLNVSKRSVASASKVLKAGTPELSKAVEAKTISVSTAATLADAPREQQLELLKNGDKKAMTAAALDIKTKAKEDQSAYKPSAFAQAVADGVHTGKKFRKKIGELTKLIDQCVIAVPLAEYFDVCAAIDSLVHVIEGCKNMPKMNFAKDMAKRLASLESEKKDLHAEIGAVIIFGHNTYPQWVESLKKAAATDEEKGLLKSVEAHFGETWRHVQSDLAQSKNAHYEILKIETVKVSASTFMDGFDVTALGEQHEVDGEVSVNAVSSTENTDRLDGAAIGNTTGGSPCKSDLVVAAKPVINVDDDLDDW